MDFNRSLFIFKKNMEELNPHQVKELLSYLQFERQKRREIRGEISGELSDKLKEKIEPDSVYSGSEAHEILESIPSDIANTTSEELVRQRDITINLISQLFLKAQDNGIVMELNIPDLENEDLTDAANLLAGKILMNEEKILTNKVQSPVKEKKEEKKVEKKEYDIDALRKENERLKAQLAMNKRQWPEFVAANNKLKELNAQCHEIKAKLGEE